MSTTAKRPNPVHLGLNLLVCAVLVAGVASIFALFIGAGR